MKMVSAAKFAKAERELKPARVYGAGAKGKGVYMLLLNHVTPCKADNMY